MAEQIVGILGGGMFGERYLSDIEMGDVGVIVANDDGSAVLEYIPADGVRRGRAHLYRVGLSAQNLIDLIRTNEILEFDLARMARDNGLRYRELMDLLRSGNVADVAFFAVMVGEFFGWEPLDPDPIGMTFSGLEARWRAFPLSITGDGM